MFHMITDNIEAYRRAVQDTAKASFANDKAYNSHGLYQKLTDCREEERIRYEGLVSIIVMVIKAAAADDPHNPFSNNGDVNQPDKPPVRPSPPPPRREE